MLDIHKQKLPDNPGVYFFLKGKETLYIGKATSLRDRVRSYFNSDIAAARGPRIVAMVEQADKIKFETTDSVLEALILEAALIKKHQPKYNAKEKDNKSFNYVVITDDEWPKVLVTRGRELEQTAFSKVLGSPRSRSARLSQKRSVLAGPFTSGSQLREALKIIRKIFPFRDKCLPARSGAKEGKPDAGKACFNRQLGLCPGVCSGEITKTEYAKIIRHLKLFFNGKKSVLTKTLEREMKVAAKKQDFEQAKKIRDQIFALKHINDVALIKADPTQRVSAGAFRIESYDIAHTSGKETVGVMVVVEDGEVQKSEYRKFKIRGKTSETAYEKCLAEAPRQAPTEIRGLLKKQVAEVSINDTANLAEVLERRANHPEWPMPNLIVIDGGKAQLNQAVKTLREVGFLARLPGGGDILVVSVVKNEKHQPKGLLFSEGDKDLVKKYEAEILLANSEAHRYALAYHRSRRDRVL